ncbi:hypothetical protein J2X72_004360 [Phyllobacterium sp. 1468]|nr:hypothetical protein [Phyllobacterium sp. 1468]
MKTTLMMPVVMQATIPTDKRFDDRLKRLDKSKEPDK